MASSITSAEFKEALSRYPAVLETFSKPPKEGALTLEALDKFRYQDAPMNFSKNTGRVMELSDLQKLVDWKIRHGAFRPTLPKLVAKNSNETVANTLKDAFAAYAENSKDIATVLDKLVKPLKGVGPATASLLLAVHDPQNVIFFSDEVFRWLTADGKKVTPKYTAPEFLDLFTKAQQFMSKINCTPIELEKVAFTLIKEKEPVPEPKPKYEPSGRPRGRPTKPDSEKKPKKPTVPGRGRGRPRLDGATKAKPANAPKVAKPAAPTKNASTPPKKRGRPAKDEGTNTPAPKKRGRPAKATAEEDTKTPASKKRGRPAKEEGTDTPAPKKRGRPAKATVEEETKTPASKKRKTETTPASSAKRSGRKAKA